MAATDRDVRSALACSNCGQNGTATWQEPAADQTNSPRQLIELTPGFHAETGRTPSGGALIVCDACDQIQSG